ncbi:hydroxyectoine utilization dehydratase EutB [Dethiosulfatarculus sandiegensis]|nr:hydroxyectoine utilization dehydratase EutB [Dethiosulfatarculus sandiegensis]
MSREKMNRLTLRDIYKAAGRLRKRVFRTPLLQFEALSGRTGREIYIKPEFLQKTGSFKVRGAFNSLGSLSPKQKAQGVIAFSTGNHGRAVALVAREMGIKALVCCSKRVPDFRVRAIRDLGAEVRQVGQSQDQAYEHALKIQKEQGLTMIAPFDDPLVIAGQGTIGLEILEDLPGLDTVLVPLSGGGLISGIALALKSADPKIKVIGVSMESAPAMQKSLEAGKPVAIPEKDSLADALLGGIGLDNQYTFDLCRRFVDQTLLVNEEQIAKGIYYTLTRQNLVLEGSGAVGISVLLDRLPPDLGKKVVVVASGGNLESGILRRLLAGAPLI